MPDNVHYDVAHGDKSILLNDIKYMKVLEGLLCGLNDPVPLAEVSCGAHLGALLTVCHQRTKSPLRIRRNVRNSLFYMVGDSGFEPLTPAV